MKSKKVLARPLLYLNGVDKESRLNFRKMLLLLGLCSFLSRPVSAQSAPELYWVTFGGDSPQDPVYLMQIDQNGAVKIAPKVVLTPARFQATEGSATLANGPSGTLNLWRIGKDFGIFRAVINKTGLTVKGLKKLTLTTTDEDAIQVTQKSSSNFLLIERADDLLYGVSLTKGGLTTGTPWLISPQAPDQNDEASVSADGKAVVLNRNVSGGATPAPDRLFIQLLDDAGRPAGSPRLLATFTDIEANDISNPLSNGNRFVVYMVEIGTTPGNKLFLQRINARGQKVGGSRLLNTSPLRDENDQNLAIDPQGRFVLFTVEGGGFGCSTDDILVYQALNLDGSKKGNLKLIAGCGFVNDDIVGIDILKQ